MCQEIMKADVRRRASKYYGEYIQYFTGRGIDIGCGSTPMPLWPSTLSITGYDQMLGHSDAHHLAEHGDETFDFVVSSHCLEHMSDPVLAFNNWLRVLKSGGFAVITIPDWEMYERKQWPSKFNGDHKTSWTLELAITEDHPAHVILVPEFLDKFPVELIKVQRILDNFDPLLPEHIDQTGGPAECAIEFIVRKM